MRYHHPIRDALTHTIAYTAVISSTIAGAIYLPDIIVPRNSLETQVGAPASDLVVNISASSLGGFLGLICSVAPVSIGMRLLQKKGCLKLDDIESNVQ